MATASLDGETSKKVIRQVEFYFSDSNLPRDKFLSKTVSDSDDGMVSLALICSFSRMRSHLNLGISKPEEVSDDTVKAVADTLKNSTFLKVSKDGKKIGRATELLPPDEVIEQSDSRTIAASPLEYDVKLEHVESFFGQFAKSQRSKRQNWKLNADGREDNYVHVSEAFMAGIAAGAVESVVSSPFELIKLCAQVNSASRIVSSDTVTARTAVSPLLARLLPGYSPDMRTLNHSVGLLFPETFEVAKTISMGPSLKSGSKVGKSGSKVHEPDEHPPQHIS